MSSKIDHCQFGPATKSADRSPVEAFDRLLPSRYRDRHRS